MIWQNMWAWAGLAALGVPVLIHLFGRGHARVRPFPTLRFLQPSRMLPVRRTRVHDLVLLAVRVSILAAAVAALAEPLLLTAYRRHSLDSALARAIVLDTSASMQRATASGERAVDVARREAQRLGREAQTSVTLEAGAASRSIAGAVAWLSRQPARRELVVVSDFQLGAFDATDLARVPPSFGVHLARIDVRPDAAPMQTRLRVGDVESVARITLLTDRTGVEWSNGPPSVGRDRSANDVILILADSTERAGADAAVQAARRIGVSLPLDTNHAIAVVFPGYERGARLLRRATAWRSPWMTDVVARLSSDALLVDAARSAVVSATGSTGVVVVRTAAARPAVIAAEGVVQGRNRLTLFSLADAGSSTSAALVATATRALSAAPLTELEPSSVAAEVLASWERPPAAKALAGAGENGNTGDSDGRWFWVLALLLLVLETWLRRAPREARVVETRHDRAA